MNISRNFRSVSIAACAALISFAALSIGCSIAVDKNKSGTDKNVKIENAAGRIARHLR